jgi:hypothetical protein
MKAICFTFDRNMPVMEYVLYTYFKHWPDNPFVFYVPWNNIKPDHLVDQYGADKVKLLQTDSAVKPTIRTLLSVTQPNEFIWWAQDDKYILDFKTKKLYKIYISIILQRSAGLCSQKTLMLKQRTQTSLKISAAMN